MAPIQNIINFYKDCYQSDVRAINIVNFFGKKIEHPYTLDSLALLNGKLIKHYVDSEWGKTMDETLTLHAQEKGLYCCSFFIQGTTKILGKSSKVFAPLYIHEVILSLESGIYYLEIDIANPVINPAFLDYLKSQDEGLDISYDEFSVLFPTSYFRFDEIIQIQEILKTQCPSLNIDALEKLMETDPLVKDLKSIYKQRSSSKNIELINGIGIGLIPKPVGSRGIINELSAIVNSEDYSMPIQELFQTSTRNQEMKLSKEKILTPVSLSNNQENVFHAIRNYKTALVIGPPGTGKSFTIAALVTDLISQGQSVLVASKNNQAGNVISDKIEKDFDLKGVVIKTAKKTYRNSLKRRLENIISGFAAQKIDHAAIGKLKGEVAELRSEIDKLENSIRLKERDELKWGKFFYQYKNTFFNRIKKRWIKYQFDSIQPIGNIKNLLGKKRRLTNQKIKKLIKLNYDYHLYKTLNKNRNEIKYLVDAMSQDIGSLMHEYFDKIDFNIILKALPAWICNASEIHKILPLQKEMFDVLIIDEATQCDIPSSLPLMQRAKKVVIVGDPKQLRHISFLSKKQQNTFADKYNFDPLTTEKNNYREHSILDLIMKSITRQDQITFLNEHYRSMPDIIRFSNQAFYDGQLKIMTSTPVTLREKNVFLHQTNGSRNGKGQNDLEATAIIEKIKTIISEETDLKKAMSQSIGILSPFRAQVALLKTRLQKEIELTNLKKHDLLIGTPFQFQGEERDVMLLSFAVDSETHPSTFIYLNREDVFNVSITRARSIQHVYSSISYKELNVEKIFTNYLASIDSKIHPDPSTYNYIDNFIEEIVDAIEKWKVDKIYKSYPIGGIEVDIVIVNNNQTYCVDLIGYPGEFESAFPLENWNRLERMNIKVFSITYTAWYLDNKKCLKELKKVVFDKEG